MPTCRSYIFDDVKIGDNVRIVDSIVCEGVVLENGVQLGSGCVLASGAKIGQDKKLASRTRCVCARARALVVCCLNSCWPVLPRPGGI